MRTLPGFGPTEEARRGPRQEVYAESAGRTRSAEVPKRSRVQPPNQCRDNRCEEGAGEPDPLFTSTHGQNARFRWERPRVWSR